MKWPSDTWIRVEREQRRPIPELLEAWYSAGMSQQRIADSLGVSRPTVMVWMDRCGIPIRDRRRAARRAPPDA